MRKFFFGAKKIAAAAGALLLLALAAFARAFFVEPNLLTTTRAEIPVAAWAGTDKRARVVVLADFHLAPGTAEEKRLARIVEKTLECAPDAVFLLGDYVKGTRREGMMDAEEIAAGLRPLAERVPVFACFGNHDGFYGKAELERAFRGAGIALMRKGAAELRVRGNADFLVLVTLDPDSFGAVPAILPKFPDEVPAGTVRTLISHSPDVFPLLAGKNLCDAAFCGHTHGGQICLPGGVPVVTSSRVVGRDFAVGRKAIPGGGELFVSRGLGTSIVPLRLFCPPEILVVDFVPARSGRE